MIGKFYHTTLQFCLKVTKTFNHYKLVKNMVKKDPDYKKPQDQKSFGAFLKKSAPIYLGLIGATQKPVKKVIPST